MVFEYLYEWRVVLIVRTLNDEVPCRISKSEIHSLVLPSSETLQHNAKLFLKQIARDYLKIELDRDWKSYSAIAHVFRSGLIVTVSREMPPTN